MSSAQKLLAEVERFLKRHDMAETAFSMSCGGDRHLVRTLRNGRQPTMATADRMRAFMARYNAEHPRQTIKPNRRRKSSAAVAAA